MEEKQPKDRKGPSNEEESPSYTQKMLEMTKSASHNIDQMIDVSESLEKQSSRLDQTGGVYDNYSSRLNTSSGLNKKLVEV